MPCKTCARLTLTLSQQFFTFSLFFYSSKYVFLLLKANKCFWALFSVLEQECLLRKKRKKTAEIKNPTRQSIARVRERKKRLTWSQFPNSQNPRDSGFTIILISRNPRKKGKLKCKLAFLLAPLIAF